MQIFKSAQFRRYEEITARSGELSVSYIGESHAEQTGRCAGIIGRFQSAGTP
jgi:hypothetical protein